MGNNNLLLMKFMTILALTIFASILVSVYSGPARATEATTRFQKSNGGELYYLDRHPVNCGSGAVSYFKLARQGGDNVAMRFSCVVADGITGPNSNKSTNWKGFGLFASTKKVVDYHHHNVECPAGTVISYFRQGRSGSNLNFGYTCRKANLICCQNRSTPENEAGSLFYLDRHDVGNWKSTTHALQRWKIDINSNASRFKFSYRTCKIRDMDAQKQVETNRASLQSEQNNLKAAQDRSAKSKAERDAIQKQVADLQAQLQAAGTARDADQNAVEAAHDKVEAAQASLAAAEKDPGLNC